MYNGSLDNQMFQIEPNQTLCKKKEKVWTEIKRIIMFEGLFKTQDTTVKQR